MNPFTKMLFESLKNSEFSWATRSTSDTASVWRERGRLGGYRNVAHIDPDRGPPDFVLLYRLSVEGIHHRLEGGWGVSEAKEHDSGLVEASPGFESGFVFVSLFDPDVIVSPSDVQLRVNVGSPQVADERSDERERVLVTHRPLVDFSVVLYRSQLPILLLDEEEG